MNEKLSPIDQIRRAGAQGHNFPEAFLYDGLEGGTLTVPDTVLLFLHEDAHRGHELGRTPYSRIIETNNNLKPEDQEVHPELIASVTE
ncbi:hypothetical protein HY468_02485 [Candidatus Roizmanbacteria bacterium]|nr:hypothetical protein [Candidatus Roizmanbacteria bacterium]